VEEREGVTIGSGNVYADIGLPDAETMLVKAGLVLQIQRAIEASGIEQEEAAETIGLSSEKLADLLRGRFRNVSTDELLRYLNLLGQNVDIVVSPIASDQSHPAKVTVHNAREQTAA
jgi:predicted XRE-type DNA-binding protein